MVASALLSAPPPGSQQSTVTLADSIPRSPYCRLRGSWCSGEKKSKENEAHVYNPNTEDKGRQRALGLGQPGLHSKTPSPFLKRASTRAGRFLGANRRAEYMPKTQRAARLSGLGTELVFSCL